MGNEKGRNWITDVEFENTIASEGQERNRTNGESQREGGEQHSVRREDNSTTKHDETREREDEQ